MPGASARKVARGVAAAGGARSPSRALRTRHDYGAWGKGIARKDLERIFAEDSDFEGVRSLRVKLYGIASKQSKDVGPTLGRGC